MNLSPSPFDGNYGATNKLGILFSTIDYGIFYPSPVNNYAQVYTDSIITDTLSWVPIRGSFIADSNYSFITIGSFFTDAFVDSLQILGTLCRAYYYVDDICVSTDSAYCYNYVYTAINESTNPFDISVYPNPAIDVVNIAFDFSYEPHDISIYDELGGKFF